MKIDWNELNENQYGALKDGRMHYKNEYGPNDKVVDWNECFDIEELKQVIDYNQKEMRKEFWGEDLKEGWDHLNDKRLELIKEGKDEEYLKFFIEGVLIQVFQEIAEDYLMQSEIPFEAQESK